VAASDINQFHPGVQGSEARAAIGSVGATDTFKDPGVIAHVESTEFSHH